MNKAAPAAFYRLRRLFKMPPPSKPAAASKIAIDKRSLDFRDMVDFKKSCDRPHFRSRFYIFRKIVTRFANNKRFTLVREILDHQKKYDDITNEGFTSRLVLLYGKSGLFEDAQKLFDEMPQLGCPRTVLSYNSLLSASVEAGRYEEFERILDEVPGALGLTKDVASYNIEIKGYCEMGVLDKALLVFEEMAKEGGVRPSLITFNTLLHGCYKNGRLEDGDKVWARMVEAEFVPDVRSYNAKLLGLTLGNRMEEAEELVVKMRAERIKLDKYCFNALISGYASAGELEEVKKCYRTMVNENCKPDECTFRMLLTFLCEKGDAGFALEISKVVMKRKYPVDAEVLQLVVDALVAESKVDEAKKLVQLAKSNEYSLVVV